MSTKTIVFFAAGSVLTTEEAAAVAKLNVRTQPEYKVLVVNGSVAAEYGEDRPIPTDYVAGDEIPELYEDVDVIDPDNIPSVIAATQAIVADEDVLDVGDVEGCITAAVTDNVLTLSATPGYAVVNDGQIITTTGSGTIATVVVDDETGEISIALSAE
jgi:hypothetical protein